MITRRALLTGATCAAIVAGVTAGWVLTHQSHGHTPGRPQLATNPAPVTVSVGNGSSVAIGDTLHVRVSTTAAGANRSVALYDGARHVTTAPLHAGATSAQFEVPAADIGVHAFTAHVDGRNVPASSSSPDPVVVDAPRGVRAVSFTPLPHETQAQAARRLGVDPRHVTITGKQPVHLDARSAAVLPRGGTLRVAVRPPSSGSPNAPADSTVPDVATTLHVAVHECTVVVTTSASGEVAVERASATDGAFVDAGIVTAKSPLRLTGLAAGQSLFQGRDHAKLTAVTAAELPESCDHAQWSGTVSIRHGMLVLPHPAASVYLYLGVDAERFSRVPADPTAFVSAPARVDPVADQLPQLSGRHLVVQAWQPPGADDASARMIGRGELTVPDGMSLADAVGLPSTLQLAYRQFDTATSDEVSIGVGEIGVPFVARTDSQTADRIVWQVLAHPLTPSNHDLDPFGLLKAGNAAVTDGRGGFVLQSNLIPRPRVGPLENVSTVYVRALAFSGSDALDLVSPVVTVELPAPPTPPRGAIPLGSRPTVTHAHVTFPHYPNPDLAGCIRVTRAASNYWNGVTHAWNPYPSTGTYCASDFESDDSCSWFLSCAIDDVASAIASGVEWAVHVAAKVWDFVVSIYDGVVGELKDLVQAALSPFCAAAKAAGSNAEGGCETITKWVADAAVDAALTSFGLPTQLPTSTDLAALAQGDLAELATQLMSQAGVPCDDMTVDADTTAAINDVAAKLHQKAPHTDPDGHDSVCYALARELVDEALPQVAQQSQGSVLANDGLPLPPRGLDNPTFAFEPEPRGQLLPAHVIVRAAGRWTNGHGKLLPGPHTCPMRVTVVPPAQTPHTLFHGATAQLRGATGIGPWKATIDLPPDYPTLAEHAGLLTLPVIVRIQPDLDCSKGHTQTLTGSLREMQPRP